MNLAHLSPEDRRRLLDSPQYRQLAVVTFVLPAAFAVAPIVLGGVLYFINKGNGPAAIKGLAFLQTPTLILSGLLTLAIITIVPKIVAFRSPTRISTSEPGSPPTQPKPKLLLLYLILCLAILEFPLLVVFVGCLIAGFEFQSFLLATASFLFGLGYLASKLRPMVLQAHLKYSMNSKPAI